jgi:monothiol glutaredoxin
MTTQTPEALKQSIQQAIDTNKICIFGKGTKDIPLCGFTLETKTFFEKYGHPFVIIDVLNDMEKRQILNDMTQWQTLPKVFINGKFYGDTDILGPMEESGELQTLLAETFGA